MAKSEGGALPAPISAQEQLDAVIGPLEQTLEQGEAHVRYLREQLDAQDHENKKVRRVLAQLRPEKYGNRALAASKDSSPASAKRGPNPNLARVGITSDQGTPTGFGIMAERGKEVAEALLKDKKGAGKLENGTVFYTQPYVYRELFRGDEFWEQTRMSAVFKWFRDIGFIRKAGKERKTSRDRWIIMDADAVDKYLANAADAAKELTNA